MRILIWAFILLLCAPPSFALPAVTREKINGFEVDFVNIAAGDRISVTFYLPVGTLHNRARTLGLAHLFEHYIHNGSVALPGHKAMKNLMSRIGATANAHTSLDHTFFFANAGQSFARELLLARLGMLGGLEWNIETFNSERETVINEIADEVMKQDLSALNQMMYSRLLPQGHPWAKPILGTEASLRALNLDDLRQYYYANYRPENLKIAIHGNFTDPNFFADVRAWTKEYLHPANESADALRYPDPLLPLASVETARFFQPGAPAIASRRLLYVHSENLKLSKVLFEGTRGFPERNWHIADLLAHYMNLTIPGSLLHTLLTEKQWITDGGFLSYHLNNRPYLSLQVTLTEEGTKHASEINEMSMRQLRSLQTRGIPAEALQLLKQGEIASLKMSTISVAAIETPYITIMDESSTLTDQVKKIDSITNEQVKDFASRFNPAHALYAQMGRETDQLETDSDYKRGYRIFENLALPRYKEIFRQATAAFEPPLPDFKLAAPANSPFEKRFAQTKATADLSERLIADFRQDLPNLAANVGLTFAPRESSDLLFLDLVIAAFCERYSEAMFNANLRYQALGSVSRMGPTLWFKGGGQSRNSVSYVRWLIETLNTFTPTFEELERARRAALSNSVGNYSGRYSADIVLEENAMRLDPLLVSNAHAQTLLGKMDFAESLKRWASLRQRADREFVLVGDLRTSDYDTLKSSAAKFSKEALTTEDHSFLANRFGWTGRSESLLLPWPAAGRSPDNRGISRTYLGPEVLNPRESVAFVALMSMWNNQIYNLNRSDLGLGYMHGTYAPVLNKKNYFLILYGQADGAANTKTAIEGWDQILNGMRNGKTTDDEIRAGISAALQTYSQKQIDAGSMAEIYAGQMDIRFDGRARERLAEELKTLSVDEVRAVALKYVLNSNVPIVQMEMGAACDDVLLGK